MRITFLGSANCPNTPPLRATLRRAVALVGIGPEIEEVDQDRLPDGDARRGYPTPTILVDGIDLYGLPPPKHPAAGCRLYPNGLPTPDEIARLIRAAIDPMLAKVNELQH